MQIKPSPARPELDRLLKESAAKWAAMTPGEREATLREQRDSYVRAEMSWPKPRFRWVDGAKVYDSYSDYCND